MIIERKKMWANPENMPPIKLCVIIVVIIGITLTLAIMGLELYISIPFLLLSFFIVSYFLPIEKHKSKKHKSEFVDKPWGGYRNVADGDGYKIKVLVITGGNATSLQSHKHRDEVWTIAKGEAKLTYGETEFILRQGDTVRILTGFKHRIVNDGEDPLVMTEVWLGDTLDEEDIIRYEDRYGRV